MIAGPALERRLVAAGCLLVAVALFLPMLLLILGRDAGVFMYVGQGILQGEVPYRDAWDHKPPLIHFTYALGLLIAGGRFWGIWALAMASLTGAGWLSYRLLRPVHGPIVAVAATAVWMLNLGYLIGDSINTEFMTLILQVGALVVLVRWRDGPRQNVWPILLGLLAGLAFLYRQNHLGTFAAVFAVGALLGLRRLGPAYLVRCLALATGGGIAALAPFAVYFLATGAWGDMWDAAFGYNFLYTGPGLAAQLDAAVFAIERIPWSYGALLVWSVALVRLVLRRPMPGGTRGALLQVALVAVPLEFFLATASGKHYPHYFATCLPALALLLAELFGFLARRPGMAARLVLGVAILAAVVTLRFDTLADRYRAIGDPSVGRATREAAAYLRDHTSVAQRSLVWGSESGVLALAGRRSATRFVYQYPLITVGYRPDEIAAEFLADIRRDPPAVIVDTGHLLFPSLDAARRDSVQVPAGVRSRVYGPVSPRLEPFFDTVAREYVRVPEAGGFDIYVPRP